MYTATLKDRVIEGGRIRWVVEFSNGTDRFVDSFTERRYTDLQRSVAQKLSELNFVDSFTIGGTIDATIEVVTPTQAEIDRNVWLDNFRKLEVANRLIQAGVIVDTLPAYVALKSKVNADFKPAYINSL